MRAAMSIFMSLFLLNNSAPLTNAVVMTPGADLMTVVMPRRSRCGCGGGERRSDDERGHDEFQDLTSLGTAEP
jgi:hypothetical protein